MEIKGLTSAQAEAALKEHGPNEIRQARASLLKKALKWMVTPISVMLVAASALSFFSGRDFDGWFILVLLALNGGIGFWQEAKADRAIERLNERLAAKIRVMRDGAWSFVDSQRIVPGDAAEIGVGEIVPADAEIVDAKNLSLNESVLTGESFLKEKKAGDKLFSGSFVATGLARVRVVATGKDTYFGKVLLSVERSDRKSILEQDILRVSRFLSLLAAGAVVLLTAFLFSKSAPLAEVLRLDLSLVIAGIPISLPTVMTLIIEFGVIELSKKGVVVRRLSALEDLANVDLLLTDKTGTMTKNDISVREVVAFDGWTDGDVVALAAATAQSDVRSVINKAIVRKADELGVDGADAATDYIPADSIRKRATAYVVRDGKPATVSVGAPQVVLSLCDATPEDAASFNDRVRGLAQRGYRTLAVAYAPDGQGEKHMSLVGVLALSDTLREDAKDVVGFMREQGIAVKLVTGDNAAIAREIASELALPGDGVLTAASLGGRGWDALEAGEIDRTQIFAEVLPEDKYDIVRAAKRDHVVAAAGDGVNDLPPLREANVGIAVKDAVDALRASADIVLTSDGIAVIKDAITESRKIFARLYTYSVYRISESLRLIFTILLLGLLVGSYPLTPVQIILLALLNDIPIISLAYDRVRATSRPAHIDVKERFALSGLFGAVGVLQSMALFLLLRRVFHVPLPIVQTLFFLKLTVSGHLLIFVAHTRLRWYRFLPSKTVIGATVTTQLIASALALSGIFMPAPASLGLVAFVWLWAFAWMQVSDAVKELYGRFSSKGPAVSS